MSTPTPNAIASIYNARSSNYDTDFHIRLASEHINCASLQSGSSVLDLACGTGLVTIPAKQIVQHGRVVGIDFSSGMLDEARRKSSEQGLSIEFFEHDITDLKGLDLLMGGTKGGFDVIFCAAALVLIKEPVHALKHWVEKLAGEGRLVVDVHAKGSMIAGEILAEIGEEIGEKLLWNGSQLQSEESVRRALEAAGLVVERVYTSEVFERRELRVEDAEEIFERSVGSPMFRNFGREVVREKAKGLFVTRLQKMAGKDGVVWEEVIFHMGVGRKQVSA